MNEIDLINKSQISITKIKKESDKSSSQKPIMNTKKMDQKEVDSLSNRLTKVVPPSSTMPVSTKKMNLKNQSPEQLIQEKRQQMIQRYVHQRGVLVQPPQQSILQEKNNNNNNYKKEKTNFDKPKDSMTTIKVKDEPKSDAPSN